MNIEIPEKKTSFIASKLSGLNSFLFWFGKKVYSFLLGLIFIIFIGAGVYAFFVGGDSVSVPDFGDEKEKAEGIKDAAEEQKKIELEKAQRKTEYLRILKKRTEPMGWIVSGDELIRGHTEDFNKIKKEVRAEFYGEDESAVEKLKARSPNKLRIDDEYGDDIKEFFEDNDFAMSNYERYVDRILAIPEDLRDDYFYGLVDYCEEAYDYYSKDDNFKIFAEQYGEGKTNERFTIAQWASVAYRTDFERAHGINVRSEIEADVNRLLALQVMGVSFLAFLIAVLIVIFIQIEANTRPENKDRT